MNLRNRIPLLAVVVLIAFAAVAAHAGYLDPTAFVAAPLLFPFIGMTASVPNAMMLRGALDKRAKLVEAMNAITATVAVGGNLTAEQKTDIDAKLADVKALDSDIARLQAMIEAERAVDIGKTILETRPRVEDDPKRGFRTFGDFLASVHNAGIPGGDRDSRLNVVAATPGATYSNESQGADGGFLVPVEFAKEIARLSLDSDAFLPMTSPIPITGNSIAFPADETTPWGTNGVRAYWAAEAAAATATKPVIKPNVMRLNKLFGLVPVSDELLADSPAISAYLTSLLGRSIKWKVNDSLVNGTGAGQPLGILNGPGLVVINKEGGQAASTLLPANVAKMFAAMPTDYLSKAVWLIAPDLFPALITLQLGNFSFWTPPMAGIAAAPGGFLLGRPIIPTQTCAAFSSQGDIVFTNFEAYRSIQKDGVQIAESMHLYFDADATAYRATFRLDGQPTFKSPIVQARGAQNLSPYITLQAR